MNNKRFKRMMVAVFDECAKTADSKGIDYTGEEDRLSDFKDMAAINDVSPATVANIFGQKHHRAIDRYRKIKHLESETLEMRVVDAINYHLLELACLVEDGYEPRADWFARAIAEMNIMSTGGNVEVRSLNE